MDAEFLDLTAENIADEHLCCIIRTKKPHPGVEAKREWLAARLREGHVFRKLNTGDCVFNNWAAFWNGSFISVNQLDGAALEKVIRRAPQP